ncbi:MAG: site-2 protease family protein [Ferroplasma sp.]|uniref:site-2 protease family protein n=1 Tax=Ferroplasma sp. TaxID=2591003 RepID=UPI00281654E5|nr:site-2 protease family protein [Ferroplasma sp.]WMT50974.1 MAG: site-2 protease family protein [Ferroplasma sp.]
MSYNEIFLIILIVFSWIIIIISLAPEINKSKHFSTMGPALMIKSTSNKGVLDAVAKHLPAKGMSRFSTILVVLGGLLAFAMLLYEAVLLTIIHEPPSAAPPLNEYLALPLINPFIPLGYGTASLVFAVVIHEMFHGIVARKHGIKVTSVGALFFIIPVGAFVEPDEKEIMAADPVVRRRIIAAGPGINLIIAIICIVLLIFVMMPASAPIHSGIYVEDSTSIYSGHSIPKGMEITSYGNLSGKQLNSLETTSMITPGMANVTLFNGKTSTVESVPTGVAIVDLLSGFPAAEDKVPTDSIIYNISDNGNSHIIYNIDTLGNVLDKIPPGTTINMTVITFGSTEHFTTYTMKTVSTYSYYAKDDPAANSAAYKDESFIGVQISYSGIGYASIDSMHSLVFGAQIAGPEFYETLGLPILGLSPIPGSLAHLFSTPFNSYIFFGIVNSLYWIFWIDFLLGIMNALPLSILDGGQFFKDTLNIASRRERFKFLRDEKNVTKIYYALGLFVFFLLLYIVIAPRIL